MILILNDLTGLPQEYALKYHHFFEKSDYIRFMGQIHVHRTISLQ